MRVGAGVSHRAGMSPIYSFVCTIPVYMRMRISAYLPWQLFRSVCSLGGHFEVVDTQHPLFLLFLFFFSICTDPGTQSHPCSLLLPLLRPKHMGHIWE